MKNYLFTSEAVTEGHPDKICDKIADKILDEALKVDSDSKMAIEATIKDDLILIYGEENTKAKLDYESIAKWVLKDIGYQEEYRVIINVSKQSSEITKMVDKKNTCAGDQGIMFGYATIDTEELMPLPIMLANKLAYQLTKYRKSGGADFLLPDGKTQVTVEYKDGLPVRIDTIVVACQHKENVSLDIVRELVLNNVVKKSVCDNLIDNRTKILINANGTFFKGGSFGDSGTTGRKIVVDTYGGACPIGGGCFSSKDPSKVDRTAAYYARYVAKNIVAHKMASKCLIQLSYVIGEEFPTSVMIDTFNTERISLDEINEYVKNNFDFRVQEMINELDLKKAIYYDLACYGHFGRDTTWEKIKKIN